MIIVEGADNCGKSTLVEQLVALDPSLRILHRDRFRPNMKETIATSYLNALLPPADGNRMVHGHSIADRFLASECIYGRLFRGGCRMTPNEHFMIKALLISYGAVVVHCNPPDETISSSWKSRPQLYDRDPIVIAEMYRSLLVRIFHPVPVFEYDWTRPNAEARRKELIAMHTRRMISYGDRLTWPMSACSQETG